MRSILKRGGIWALVAIMIWCVTGCGVGDFGYPNEELVLEYEVTRVTLRQIQTSEPFPCILRIFMRRVTGGGISGYSYYSEKDFDKDISVDTLVTVNGEAPSGVYLGMWGGINIGEVSFSVYLDFLPKEGDVAVFNSEWFFAYPNDLYPTKEWEKVRIITESMPITIP
jgi:hypothetical protein